MYITRIKYVMEIEEREKKIYRVTLMGSVVNVVLLVFKFVAGILGGHDC